MKNKIDMTVMVLCALIAGQAVHYFLTGKGRQNTDTWNVLVVLQFLVAFGALLWSGRKYKNNRTQNDDTHKSSEQ